MIRVIFWIELAINKGAFFPKRFEISINPHNLQPLRTESEHLCLDQTLYRSADLSERRAWETTWFKPASKKAKKLNIPSSKQGKPNNPSGSKSMEI